VIELSADGVTFGALPGDAAAISIDVVPRLVAALVVPAAVE
jgi:hypothetical protein